MDEKAVQHILGKIDTVKTELKNSIQASESNILLGLEDLKHRFRQLESEKIEQFERRSRRNNIIVFGWTASNEDIDSVFVCAELNKLLGIEIHGEDINDFFCLGRKSNRPVKIEFVSYLKEIEVLRSAKKLRGTGVAIAGDLTEQQRGEYQVLKKFLIEERKKGKTCYIKGGKLVVNNREFSIHELQEFRWENAKSDRLLSLIPCGCSFQMDPFIREYHNKPILAKIITDLKNFAPQKRTPLNILQLNIRSIMKNMNELVLFLNGFALEFQIIVLSETYLVHDLHVLKIDGFTTLYNEGVLNRNDGVVVYIKDDIHFTHEVRNLGDLKL